MKNLLSIWKLSLPYFISERKWKARGLLITVILLNLVSVYAMVLLNDWNRLFYDSLQNKQSDVFWEQLGRFVYLAFGYMVVMVYKFYITQRLQMDWREWLTHYFTNKWLSSNNYYRLEVLKIDNQDNPDQRIAEDVNSFTSLTTSLTMGLLHSFVTLVSFVGILWGLSGAFTLFGINIPGFMVWLALVYCVIGSVISHIIGKKLYQLNWNQQHKEADFRYQLIKNREYSDAISLDKGHISEKNRITKKFSHVMSNLFLLVNAQKSLTWFTSGFNQASVVFPFLFAAPRFFSGAIQLGQLMQIASAFGRVEGALSWFVGSYSSLAEWLACSKRLISFEEQLVEQNITDLNNNLNWEAKSLIVKTPNNFELHSSNSWVCNKGDTVLIRGKSGIGKSSLLRVLSGTWGWYSGEILKPSGSIGHLVQKPYLPNSTIKEILSYPDDIVLSDEECIAVLNKVHLNHLVSYINIDDNWQLKLSGGECQRLAFARILLRQHDWLILDEPTSALDSESENNILSLLSEYQTKHNCGIIMVSHREVSPWFNNIHYVDIK